MKILIVRAEEGNIVDKQLTEGELEQILKEVVIKALELWNPQHSDLVVVKHKHEVGLPLPLKKEQYEMYARFNLRRIGDKAVFEIPIYVVSYENEWIEENIRDSKVFIVAPYVDETTASNIIELAKNITSAEVELEESEEELEEE
ncbi:MAG: DUF2286 domain-containing protein [Ignisphaera sp.]